MIENDNIGYDIKGISKISKNEFYKRNGDYI